jgi:hypothetical protein
MIKKCIIVLLIASSFLSEATYIPPVAHYQEPTEHTSLCYSYIKKLLMQYRRPVTVLMIGASDSWLPFSIAHDYDATVVIASYDYNDVVLKACSKEPEQQSIILLKKHFSLEELERLGQCEHFDVVLVIDGFMTLPLLRKPAFGFITRLGDYCIIKVPEAAKPKGSWRRLDEIRSYIQEAGAQVLNEQWIDTSVMMTTYKQKTTLIRAYWNKPHTAYPGDYIIDSSYEQKTLYKRQMSTVSVWQRGINIHTFKMLAGVYPSLDYVKNYVKRFQELEHNDLNPCNLIMQGKHIVPIDFNDVRRDVNPKDGYEHLVKFLSE